MKGFRAVSLALLLGLLAVSTSSADVIKGFTEHYYTETGSGITIPFRLKKPPGYDEVLDRDFPLILFLHGAGERGTDNREQVEKCIGNLITHSNQASYASFILAPQSTSSWMSYGEDFSDPSRITLQILELVQSYYRVDPTRIYVTGLSMGGGGTFDMIGRQTNFFAAAVPICGYGDESRAPNMVNQPLWAFHAADDGTVSVDSTREMIDAIRDAGGDPLYTEYATGGHGIWGTVYNTDAMYDWMFSQVLTVPEPATIGLLISGLLILLPRRRVG